MKKNILFVDDDAQVLEGLRLRLHRKRSKWRMQFVESGRKALDILEQERVDVIVSDMRMPEMDGATLLTRVRDLYPGVVRIILSGHAELSSVVRAVPVAHQYLTKPCEPGTLEKIIDRACSLRVLINEEVVQQVVGRIEKLPSRPQIYSQLMTAMSNEKVSSDDIAFILKQDMAMCAKTLQMVNSAFFRLPRMISRIEEAVAHLGFSTIKQIVLAVEIFRYPGKRMSSKFSLDELQSHAFLVANFASSLLGEKQEQEDAFVAGLLHDIGKLVLAVELPEQVDEVVKVMETEGISMHVAERRLYGATHAEVGGYLLGLWGLPCSIVEAVSNHHTPSKVDSEKFGILGAVHIADALISEEVSLASTGIKSTCSLLDSEFCRASGASREIAKWRETARGFMATS